MKKIIPILIVFSFLFSCGNNKESKSMFDQKQEIINVEKAFEKAVRENGLAEAFYLFADEKATIKRDNNILITGKENIKKYYLKQDFRNVKLSWSPDFIEVADDASLAYTYGKYNWESTDSNGNISKSSGIFNTIWKKQKDGSWKYVWD